MTGTWRFWRPEIFANFNGELGIADGKQLITTNLKMPQLAVDGRDEVSPRREPALLVELVIIRVRGFRNGAHDTPTCAHKGTI